MKLLTRRAFTLIELLVVVAIISLLAAILFPSFSLVRDKARATSCASNLKQIGLGYAQYEQDFDEMVPCGLVSWGRGLGWAGQIYPYLKSSQVFTCPSDLTRGAGVPDVVSYAVNANMVAYYNNATHSPDPMKISSMTEPTRAVQLFEVAGCAMTISPGETSSPAGNGTSVLSSNTLYGAGSANGATSATAPKYATGLLGNAYAIGGNSSSTLSDITPTSSYFTGADGRHQTGANYLLADNHVKWLKPGAIGAGQDWPTLGAGASCKPYVDWNAPTLACGINAQSQAKSWAATFALH